MTLEEFGYHEGQRVFVSDAHSEFDGEIVGITSAGMIKVKDLDTGEIMVGSDLFIKTL